LGRKAVNKVRPTGLDKFYRDLLAAGVGRVMIRKVHMVVHGALKQAVRWDLIPSNPAEHATPPSVPSSKTAEKTPSSGDVRTLIAQADLEDPDFAMLVVLAAASGARRGELVALRWSDVDL
jgi:integrase